MFLIDSQKIQKIKNNFLWFFVCCWLVYWGLITGRANINNIPYYKAVFHGTWDDVAAYHGTYDEKSDDYFDILRYCDRRLPKGRTIQLILPLKPKRKYEFLEEKGRYYLYPRNLGNNKVLADYILVYGVNNFKPPGLYEQCLKFSSDKYLLIHSGYSERKSVCGH